ncbi:MAG: 3-phosphoserine/phosphohydroxythreonine transaminase, partial [Bacteroidales bacterium]|nr:3-phosphoserine/phosphohydroxythreonine transaminase [Bacteroidales bacterium]
TAMNMARKNKRAAYIDTGAWSSKAIKEAKNAGLTVDVVASSKDQSFNYIPKNITAGNEYDYIHITSNNTIFGTQFQSIPKFDIPVVCDMSSDIFSRKVDVSKYALIYGGAQKNLAPSGVTFVIVRHDVLGKVEHKIPTMLNYQTHIDKNSMFNTPPVIPVFTALQTMKWVTANGGVEGMNKRNNEKASAMYNEIDRNKLFKGTVAKEDRSIMNACFIMNDEYKDLEAEFLDFATSKGMVGIKGHRSVGGFRASLYNALDIESVNALVDVMKEFESKHQQ